ncbi:hypothetical protein [Perlabentimonas gracilis]|uniref:hypothetical protein n=1 Tax=Perlabentimonas gracilis TaxID=2715279 RepID=UPI00140CFA8E|nr:hypothetical protein [Perlabentimonas gracilis]NHB70393.1 hypothetical protein [Perlabentimonas gracilis]
MNYKIISNSILFLLLSLFYFSIYAQPLDKTINYGNISLKIPSKWENKNQNIENKVTQIACWDNNSGSNLLIQYSDNLMTPDEYINSIINYQKNTPIYSTANYSKTTDYLFNGIQTKKSEFYGI